MSKPFSKYSILNRWEDENGVFIASVSTDLNHLELLDEYFTKYGPATSTFVTFLDDEGGKRKGWNQIPCYMSDDVAGKVVQGFPHLTKYEKLV